LVDIGDLQKKYEEIENMKKYDFSWEMNITKTNKLYEEFRKSQVFIEITEKVKYIKLPDDTWCMAFGSGYSLEETDKHLEEMRLIIK